MKKYFFLLAVLIGGTLFLTSFKKEKHCVFKTVMNENPVDRTPVINHIDDINKSVQNGLDFLKAAQQANGGWGCVQHVFQSENNAQAVQTDPATTAMVGMALLRAGSTLEQGPFKKELEKATYYLMSKVEQANPNNLQITHLKGTQIQRKLGQNIDLVLTTQFFTNLLPKMSKDHPQRTKLESLLATCVDGIQIEMADNGSLKGGTWAGVLQSSYANSALESAQAVGVKVDEMKLGASRKYQEANYDLSTNEVSTADGAGILLYSVSGSARASAKEAKRAQKLMERAKASGQLKKEEPVNTVNLMKAGLDEEDAIELSTSYQIYQSAKVKSQRSDVMSGFGNNGGEEFLSFLQTGESLILNEDDEWTNWYDNITKTIMDIQNNNGSWNGHHCITSPVFCTATCVSLLTINNDIEHIRNTSN